MRSALVWFRRDLRCFDHAALHHALSHAERVYCAFVFDTGILDGLPSRRDRRVAFIHGCLIELDAALDRLSREAGQAGSGVWVRHGRAEDWIPALATRLEVDCVVTGRDYTPQARSRDEQVARRLADLGIGFESVKDQVLFECDEILTASGRPYRVFTPYRNAWLRELERRGVVHCPVGPLARRLAPKAEGECIPALAEIGFAPAGSAGALPAGSAGGLARFEAFCERIDHYRELRDRPASGGGSGLSVDLRFGTVSIRELVAMARNRATPGALAWLDELIWRDFFQMILWHFPHVVERSFRPEFDVVRWETDPDRFAAWCEGRTGYPLVDAGMRELNTTGFMHNRLRMITASFLTKDLGIDWRLGERYFAERLNDYELASNNGGWQWAASTGCDAQPWFRIFNPVTQSERFDPEGRYILRYVPELSALPPRRLHAPWMMSPAEQAASGVRIGIEYPPPLVDHALARARTLERFAVTKRP